jgi:hypothetical protein
MRMEAERPDEPAVEERTMRRIFGFLIGIAVGALVGSTVALLLAPFSGERLRAELRSRGDGFLVDVRQAAEERRTELTDRLGALRAPREESA